MMKSLVIVLAGLAVLLALELGIRYARERLQRYVRDMRLYDQEADAFQDAAMRLLKMEGLPNEIVNTIAAFNELMLHPEMARRALCTLAAASEQRKELETDAGYRRYRKRLQQFFELMPEARQEFEEMSVHGLRALVLRAAPGKMRWLLGLLQHHLLREEEMALALAREARKNPALREELTAA